MDNAFRYATIDCYIDVKNATNAVATYAVTSRSPDYLESLYLEMPLSWISVSSPNIVVLPGQVSRVPIVVKIPKVLPSKKMEFWVSVKNTGMSGMIKTELCAKWFVNIR